jgi:hypothetical protein
MSDPFSSRIADIKRRLGSMQARVRVKGFTFPLPPEDAEAFRALHNDVYALAEEVGVDTSGDLPTTMALIVDTLDGQHRRRSHQK